MLKTKVEQTSTSQQFAIKCNTVAELTQMKKHDTGKSIDPYEDSYKSDVVFKNSN